MIASRGDDVHTVFDEGLRGCDDGLLAEYCRAEGRVLVTLDLDFADIRAFPPAQFAGLIVLRVANQSRQHVLAVMTRILDLLEHERVEGRLWIATDTAVRIRES